METREAITLACSLMGQHGLLANDWSLKLGNGKKRMGLCDYSTRTITLSQVMIAAADRDQVEQTTLHEIAHALTPGAGHGPVWKAKARQIGYRGERQINGDFMLSDDEKAMADLARTFLPRVHIRRGMRVRSLNGVVGVVKKVNRVAYEVHEDPDAAGKVQAWGMRFGSVIPMEDAHALAA